MTAELCRTIAHEAVRRGARSNVHELWAALERVDALSPRLVVDVGSGPAVWFAWWAMGAQVVGVDWTASQASPAFSGDHLPESVVELVGDPRDAATALRVKDQTAKRPVDVLVLSGIGTELAAHQLFAMYAPMVRPGGLVLVQGIADRRTPGIRAFWRGLDSAGSAELIANTDPIGYGVVQIHGKDRAAHA